MILDYNVTLTKPQREIFKITPEQARFIIVTKGRRFGATHGAAKYALIWVMQGLKVLWGDTIHTNIDKYIERFMLPEIKQFNLPIQYNKQSKQLTCELSGGLADFRSAEKPQFWEGFGYHRILLNEAGIILANEYLYTNAVLPMLIDYPDAQLFALGVPKGKKLKTGRKHPFYKLAQAAIDGRKGYMYFKYSSYDNPLLREEDINDLKAEISAMTPEMVAQEIYGEFIDAVEGQLFAYTFEKARHIKPATFNPALPTFVSLDFNIQPFAAIIVQREGQAYRVVDEIEIKTGSIPEMAERIKSKLGNAISITTFTGDYTGGKRSIEQSDNASLWSQLQRELRIGSRQMNISFNPQHKTSREDSNYFLYHYPDFTIDARCANLINDLETVQVDSAGKLLKSDRSKSAQRADFLDTFRYFVHNIARGWLEQHRKTKGKAGNYQPAYDLMDYLPDEIKKRI
jgi:hypothetical protein